MGTPGDDGCLICGRAAGAVPIGVFSQYAGQDARQGARVWLCEDCARVREYARAFVVQAREHYGSGGGQGDEQGAVVHAFGYRIASPLLRELVDEAGTNLFHAWTIDL